MNRPSQKALRLGEALFDYIPYGLTRLNAVQKLAEMADETNHDLREAVRAVQESIKRERRVPAHVFAAAQALPPADLLTATAARLDIAPPVQSAVVRPNSAAGSGHPDSSRAPRREGHAEFVRRLGDSQAGFGAPKLMELARLQAWTLKPATPGR